jgi:hypothetical protein
MAMKFLTFHDESAADFAPDNQDDNLVSLDIIQGTQLAYPQFKLGERVGAQALDGFRGRRGLVLQPGQDRGFQDPLFAHRQRPELPGRLIRDGDAESHAIASAAGVAPIHRQPSTKETAWRDRQASLRPADQIRCPANSSSAVRLPASTSRAMY